MWEASGATAEEGRSTFYDRHGHHDDVAAATGPATGGAGSMT